MNEPIIPPPCTRCQRREAAINAYAEDIVEADARIADLEADNRTLRELLSVALERLAAATSAQSYLRSRVAALLTELRELRCTLTRRAA